MRITNSLKVDSLQHNIDIGLTTLNTVQQEISTGKKLNLPSDDPAGASQALGLRSALTDNAQYQKDAAAANSFLSASDNALTTVTDLLTAARQITVAGASSTQTPESRNALSQQVDGIIHQLTVAANQTYGGKYLFSGTQTQTAPYTEGDTAHLYHGNSGSLRSAFGPGDSVTLNTPGDTAFGKAFASLESLKANLGKGDIAALSTNLNAIDSATGSVSTARAVIGAKINQVTATTQNLTKSQGNLQEALSGVEDVDLAQAYVQLQSAQNIYQASLVTTSKAFQYSLSQYLG